jgi:adenosylhomocysteinase
VAGGHPGRHRERGVNRLRQRLRPESEEEERGKEGGGVLTARDLPALADGVILANAGHFPTEIDVDGIAGDPRVLERAESTDGIATFRLADGRSIHLLGGGHMLNLSGPRPLGNSIESMDLGFSLQARCLEAVARGTLGADSCVVPVPRAIDEQVAAAYVAIARRRAAASPVGA